jgi:hypothetical protein
MTHPIYSSRTRTISCLAALCLSGPVAVVALSVANNRINPAPTEVAAPVTAESLVAKNELAMTWACESSIKKQLRDPDSYKYETVKFWPSASKENGKAVTAVVVFRSKNGFGGYVGGSGECGFDANAELIGSAIVL